MRILVVDDERSITNSLIKVLSHEGYETRGAYSAEEAQELMLVWPPDLAIIDFHLPKMNGLDLASRLKAQYADCRVLIFASEITAQYLLENARREGLAFDAMPKPVHPKDLLKWAEDNKVIEPS